MAPEVDDHGGLARVLGVRGSMASAVGWNSSCTIEANSPPPPHSLPPQPPWSHQAALEHLSGVLRLHFMTSHGQEHKSRRLMGVEKT